MLDHLDIVRDRRCLNFHIPLIRLYHAANISKFVSSFCSLFPGSGVSLSSVSGSLSFVLHDRGNISFTSQCFKQWRRKQLSVTLTYSLSPLSLSCTFFQFSSLWFCIWADAAFILCFQMRWDSLWSLVEICSKWPGLSVFNLFFSACYCVLVIVTDGFDKLASIAIQPDFGILKKQCKMYICLALSYFKYHCKACSAITVRLSDKLLIAIFKPFVCVKEIEAQQ